MPLRVKICCIASVAEANMAIAHGASALGLVSAMPSGPGVISDELIAEIAGAVPPYVSTFLLTSRTDSDSIVRQARACGTNSLQIVDAVADAVYGDLRRELPETRIVQVVHVDGEDAVEVARRIAPRVDALLLDSGNRALPVKELGGTGRTHDWALSRRIVAAVKCPVFLAGGLNAGNVFEAIDRVRPYGVDLCSGVRTDGRLDPIKLNDFFAAVRRVAA
jgi:phosphoribosylanthranilate isomerase